jgi:hypothetical protein
LRLPKKRLGRIEDALREQFADVRRVALRELDIFTAAR